LNETDASSPQYRYLRIIDEETKRCQKIIQELLQFARPSATDLCPTEIQQVVEKTINLMANQLYKQKIEVCLNVAENLPRINADVQQLEQVMINLYLNAIDAMPQGGRLTVGTQLENGNGAAPLVVVTVRDTGFGIEKENGAKIFMPFFTAKKTKGLGLGLPICERIVKNHGGRIVFQSEPGLGTTFEIYLPLINPPAEDRASDIADPTRSSTETA
jgi:two-component system NtrC family sensor kinase